MRILVLNPPYFPKFSRPQRSPAVTKSGTLYYPVWLAYATGHLERQGHEVRLVDAPAVGQTLADVMTLSREFSPEMLVVDTTTPSILNDISVVNEFRAQFPDCRIVLVGTHASGRPVETLEMCAGADIVASGEYEMTLEELAAHPDRSLAEVTGITWRKEEEIVTNIARAMNWNLDGLPFAAEVYSKHLRIKDYFNPNALYPMVTIITGRGCPYRCTFCVYPQTMHGHKYRCRSVENVADEFEWVQENLPRAKAIFIEDDTLTVDRERSVALANELIKRKIKLSWTANSRADVDYETLRAMKEAGLRQLCVGFESGDQQVLNNIKKGIKVSRFEKFMEDARRAEVQIHGCFMVGNPGETKETMAKTLDLALRINPTTAQFYPVMVYPGTEAYDEFEAKGMLEATDYGDWLTPDGLHNTVVRNPDISPRELVEFCDDARRQFYLRPKYLAMKLKQAARDWHEAVRLVKGFRTFCKYLFRGSFAARKPA